MKPTEYAIVDIETTGGNASGSRITEIAIIIHNGIQIIDRWETLVNPQKEIPRAIFALTGIDNDLVAHAPIFDNVAEKVLELLTDRIFVAHNVNFDYSFIRHELQLSGFKWSAKKLCTVRAARKIQPGFSSYSLGNLCRSLNISIENRHRAGGDADATAILFAKLVAWDTDGVLDKMIKKTAQDQRLPPNLPPEDFERLPEKPGIYYFYNQAKKVVYVGKAVNIKKRVASHFSGNNIKPQRQNFLRDIYSISCEVCATELMALLLEAAEIKNLWPVYNKALKRFEPQFGLYDYEARSGHKYLAIGKVSKFQVCIEYFNTLYEGVDQLRQLAATHEIDFRFCKFCVPGENESQLSNDTSPFPDVELHNQKVYNAIAALSEKRRSFTIIDKGRTQDERSCILVEDGHFYGMGYISNDVAITELAQVRDHVTRYRSNHYIMQLISSFAEKFPAKCKYDQIFAQEVE